MKTLTAAVTVAIVVTIMCILRSSAVPVVEEQLLVELMNTDNPAAEPEEISVNSWKKIFILKKGRCTKSNKHILPLDCTLNSPFKHWHLSTSADLAESKSYTN
uniref:Uncharacterized protein n=1 Tax=Maylandia zebra TaxID=106582 RepID=A0A3P9BVM2_9CICH